MAKKRIGVTAGCPAGIGPEVLARGLAEASLDDEAVEIELHAPASLLIAGAERAGVGFTLEEDRVHLVSRWYVRSVRCTGTPSLSHLPVPGQPDDEALRFQRDALVEVCRRAAKGELGAIVTGPIRKRALSDVDGASFPGQTELCHHFLKSDDDPPLMCFAGGPFLLGLATVHLPLKDVPAALSRAGLLHALSRLDSAAHAVRPREGKARLVALGLNPHAGEGGLLGDEEQRVIAPALEEARGRGLVVEGPLPADGFFASVHRMTDEARPDGVLAMFHDQGLCAYKVLAQGRGVNLTWGLTVPRTSPDHGTADALAGTGRADASSMASALELAARLAVG